MGRLSLLQCPLWKCNTNSRTTLGLLKSQGRSKRSSKRNWGGESFQWTTRKAYLALEPLVGPFMILLGNDCLTCKFLRASNAYSSTCVSQHLLQRLHSQKAACVSVCWLNTAINSTLFHYHLLPMLVHWYVIILSLSLLDFLMEGYSTSYWSRGCFTAGEFCLVYLHCVEALDLLIKGSLQMYELLSRSIYKNCMWVPPVLPPQSFELNNLQSY